MSPGACFAKKQALNTGLNSDEFAKDNDPYSWKYFYKLSKDRKARRDEEYGNVDEKRRLFSQGPLTSEVKVASMGIESTTMTPHIKMIDKAKKLNNQPLYSSLTSRLTN